MSDEKKILRVVEQTERGSSENHPDFMFWCPGCKCGHGIWTTKRNSMSAVWTFNGNMERPSFLPSLLIKSVECPPEDAATNDFKRGADGKYLLDSKGRLLGAKDTVCHSLIENGMIRFLGDCTHEFAGKTIPMEPF